VPAQLLQNLARVIDGHAVAQAQASNQLIKGTVVVIYLKAALAAAKPG